MKRAAPLVLIAVALAGCERPSSPVQKASASQPQINLGGGTAPLPLAVRLGEIERPVRPGFRRPPRAGLLFDVDTGEVLWQREATRRLPIASLTKMMTALLVTERVPEGSKVKVTHEALRYRGSGVGLLPRGRWIGVNTMLHGLLLPSGNDAAIALAQKVARTVPDFVALMNARSAELGLPCTTFASPDGLSPRNRSCAADQAAIARALLREPRLARIVGRRRAVMPFPIKGGRLWLNNNNPLLRSGYRGATGVKTGYTVAAGRCLVATAERGGVRLGVVLLNSYDPGRQARRLLDLGFEQAL